MSVENYYCLRDFILKKFIEVLERTDKTLRVPEITDDTILLESGMDSLGFAILVATLDEELGYDPFTLMEEAVYPSTFGEFVAIYEKYKK